VRSESEFNVECPICSGKFETDLKYCARPMRVFVPAVRVGVVESRTT